MDDQRLNDIPDVPMKGALPCVRCHMLVARYAPQVLASRARRHEALARQQAAQPHPPLAAVMGDGDGNGGHRQCQADAGESADEQNFPGRHGSPRQWSDAAADKSPPANIF
jgi:hypothetical protein